MFKPWHPKNLKLPTRPLIKIKEYEAGAYLKIELSFYERLSDNATKLTSVYTVEFTDIIAFYVIEESVFEMSDTPELPQKNDFEKVGDEKQNSCIWMAEIDSRRNQYSLDHYTDNSLKSYMVFSDDIYILIENVGKVFVCQKL